MTGPGHRSPGRGTGGLVVDHDTPALGETATATFGPAQACRRHPEGPTTACADCHPYRYRLTRAWNETRPAATFVMLNPSTADALALDPTVRRCLGYARAWNCGALLVLNVFGLRSTDPRALRRHPDPVGPETDQLLDDFFAHQATATGDQLGHGPIIAAWGAHATHLDRGRHVAHLAAHHGVQLSALAITNAGHPGHPLYLPANARPIPYEPPAPAAA
ncbi:DUF1643 domain-containing protein [Micromonospora lupini]|uniref:DUF1643 domain-containing protein n=1 Tax=Micromonospora lupini TaxID=285679 RepID=UPI002250FEA3|nr:DUF1643 domain-containing protein [Micromonospora lupini]MCX5070887.1 DUF1643 domain-containing protein [Micromonospora lupini]